MRVDSDEGTGGRVVVPFAVKRVITNPEFEPMADPATHDSLTECGPRTASMKLPPGLLLVCATASGGANARQHTRGRHTARMENATKPEAPRVVRGEFSS